MISFRHVIFSSRKRFEGFQRACLEAAIPARDIHYTEPEDQESLLRQLQNWISDGMTGLFAFCDVEAWSLITLMENAGIPKESEPDIVGFDNILRYINFPKPICTIDPHLHDEARTAIDLLRKRIHQPDLPPQQVILPVTLVCRGSCG